MRSSEARAVPRLAIMASFNSVMVRLPVRQKRKGSRACTRQAHPPAIMRAPNPQATSRCCVYVSPMACGCAVNGLATLMGAELSAGTPLPGCDRLEKAGDLRNTVAQIRRFGRLGYRGQARSTNPGAAAERRCAHRSRHRRTRRLVEGALLAPHSTPAG